MSTLSFVPGQLYHRRKDIHGKYKGQERGGMITPASVNAIFLVTGDSGRQHGYQDTWSEDGNVITQSAVRLDETHVADLAFAVVKERAAVTTSAKWQSPIPSCASRVRSCRMR